MVSRVTGFGRVVAIGAVLGPTYLGNTFQAVNQLPNLAYAALTGSLVGMMLVPAIVAHVDDGDPGEVERVAGGFLGLTMMAFAAVAAVAVLAGPLVLRVLALGVADPAVADAQRRAGWVVLALVMPQVVLYGVAGVGEAVQNAHARFALAAAAPLLENVGIIVVMAVVAAVFGTGTDVSAVPTAELVVLGLGSTCAVAAHAGAQWWGARRVGVRLVPRAGWRDPDLRLVMARALPSLGYAALNSLRFFAMLVVANRVPGGVVAFQLAINFFYLPVAIGAWPVAVALLPRLSRLHLGRARREFRDELVRGSALTFFLSVPAAVGAIALASPLARAIAFGEMGNGRGYSLVAGSLAALAIGVVGEASFVVGTHAAYALDDAPAALRSMVVRMGVSLLGMVAAFAFHDRAVLVILGLGVSAGNLVGAWHLARAIGRRLPGGGERVGPPLLRAMAASLLMVGPAYAVAVGARRPIGGHAGDVIAFAAAAVVGVAVFVAAQRALRSPELEELRRGMPQRRRGGNRRA